MWLAIRSRLARLSPRVILALGWLMVFIYGFPGIMSLESIRQLAEGRDGVYTDLSPAVVSGLWRVTRLVFGGPFGMFIIQITMFIVGLYLVLRRAMSERAAAVAASVLALFPPVLVPMGVVWKEAPMAGALLLGVAGLTSEQRSHRLWGLAACAFASAVCYSAVAATLPLILILFTWFPVESTGSIWRARLRRYGVATGTWLVVTASALGINALLTDKELDPWTSTVALFDTAGTLTYADETYSDEQLRELARGTELLVDKDIHTAIRSRYRPAGFHALVANEGRLWDVSSATADPLPEARREAITRMFWESVTEHPGAYLHHRWEFFKRQLATDGVVFDAVMQHRFQSKELMHVYLSLTTNSSPLQQGWQRRLLTYAKKSPIQRPWIYLVVGLLLLPLCRRSREAFALLLSGIGLAVGLFFTAHVPGYRNLHWMVLATCIAIIVLVARRTEQHPRSDASAS